MITWIRAVIKIKILLIQLLQLIYNYFLRCFCQGNKDWCARFNKSPQRSACFSCGRSTERTALHDATPQRRLDAQKYQEFAGCLIAPNAFSIYISLYFALPLSSVLLPTSPFLVLACWCHYLAVNKPMVLLFCLDVFLSFTFLYSCTFTTLLDLFLEAGTRPSASFSILWRLSNVAFLSLFSFPLTMIPKWLIFLLPISRTGRVWHLDAVQIILIKRFVLWYVRECHHRPNRPIHHQQLFPCQPVWSHYCYNTLLVLSL